MLELLRNKARIWAHVRALLASAGVPLDQQSEVWGPIVADQWDHSGRILIQQYVSLLVRRQESTTGSVVWRLVRQVNLVNETGGQLSAPLVREMNRESAEYWLVENRVATTQSRRF
ncbi:MAG: hypothetical protein U0939_16635 [Pirellulales bacterium]